MINQSKNDKSEIRKETCNFKNCKKKARGIYNKKFYCKEHLDQKCYEGKKIRGEEARERKQKREKIERRQKEKNGIQKNRA